jgi:hypothetical protein
MWTFTAGVWTVVSIERRTRLFGSVSKASRVSLKSQSLRLQQPSVLGKNLVKIVSRVALSN